MRLVHNGRSTHGTRWAVLSIAATLVVTGCSSGGESAGTAQLAVTAGATESVVTNTVSSSSSAPGSSASSTSRTFAASGATTTTTSSGGSTPGALPAEFAAAPALVVYGAAVRTPLAYLPHPNGEYKFVAAPPSDTKSAVSPDLQYIAVDQRTTAVAAGGFQITAFATGKQETASYPGVQADDPHWSTDGRLLSYQDQNGQYLYRVGGGTLDFKIAAGGILSNAFTSDATRSAVVGCTILPSLPPDPHGYLTATVTDGATPKITLDPHQSCALAEATVRGGDLVAVYTWAGGLYQLAADGQSSQVSTAAVGAEVDSVGTLCNGLVAVNFPGGVNASYDVQTGVLTNPGTMGGSCDRGIVVSPDRKAYAVTRPDGVYVIAEGSGTATQVARTGVPVAWGADSSTLLVGNTDGLYVVPADGSGGAATTAALDPKSKSAFLWCRAADTGLAVFMTTAGPVLYDVAAGTSTPLPGSALGDSCSVTPDGGWLVSGSLLVNLKDRKGALLPPYDTKAQQPTTLPASGLAPDGDFTNYRWSGPQDVTASQSRR